MPNSFCGWRRGSGRYSKWSRWAVHQLRPPNGSESSSSHGVAQTKHTGSHFQLLPNSLCLNLMETPEEKPIPAGPDVGEEAGDGRLEMGSGEHLPSVLVACHQHVGGAAVEVDT